MSMLERETGWLVSYPVKESGDYEFALPEGSHAYRFQRKQLKIYNGSVNMGERTIADLNPIPRGSRRIMFSVRHGMKSSTYTDPAFE